MSMEKYGTYNIFKNVETSEIKRVPLVDQEEMVKTANSLEWELIDKEPEEDNEGKGFDVKAGS